MPLVSYILNRDAKQCDYYEEYRNTCIYFYTKTLWSANENSPHFFNTHNYLIRILSYKEHVMLQALKNNKTLIISYHSSQDEFQTAPHKISLIDLYRLYKFKVKFHLIENESQIDGKFIKDLSHGLRITDKALFSKELPYIFNEFQNTNFEFKKDSISYPCGNKIFTFKDINDKFELEIT